MPPAGPTRSSSGTRWCSAPTTARPASSRCATSRRAVSAVPAERWRRVQPRPRLAGQALPAAALREPARALAERLDGRARGRRRAVPRGRRGRGQARRRGASLPRAGRRLRAGRRRSGARPPRRAAARWAALRKPERGRRARVGDAGYEFIDLGGATTSAAADTAPCSRATPRCRCSSSGWTSRPGRITGVIPAVLAHFGVAAPRYARRPVPSDRAGDRRRWWRSSSAGAVSPTRACSRRWPSCRESSSSPSGARPRLRRRRPADRRRADDLAAVHGRPHLRGAGSRGRRARARRRHGLRV